MLRQVVGEILGHALRERRHEHALVHRDALGDLRHEVVDLVRRRPHVDLGVHEPGRPHHLLDDLLLMRRLVRRRCRRHEHGLRHQRLELVEAKRTVVERARQPEAVVDEVLLAGPVAAVHAADLRHGHVTLVDDHQRALRHVVDERRRRFACEAPRQMARVVLDALAEPQLVEHLEIEARALFDALCLDELVLLLKLLDAFAHLDLDGLDRLQRRAARRDVVARRVHREARDLRQDLPGQRIEERQRFDLVVEQREPQRRLGVLGRKDVDDVAAHAELAAAEFVLVALVLHLGQALDHEPLRNAFVFAQVQDHRVIVDRIADPVDRGDRRDDHRVGPLEERLRGRQPHLLDVVVDARILLDEEIARGHVGLGLVVVVVRDEVLDRVLGKELAHLGVELRGERLVRRHHDRRATDPGDDVRHRVRLARPRDTEQRLEIEPASNAVRQTFDRLGLIARGLERLMKPEGTVGERDDHG